MKKENKTVYKILLAFIIIFSGAFLSLMGYLNFSSNYQQIQDGVFYEICNESVEKIETAIGFGKSLDNYYGMAKIFQECREQLPNGVEFFVLDKEDAVRDTSFEEGGSFAEFVCKAVAERKFQNAKVDAVNKKSISIDGCNYLLLPIQREGSVIGYYTVVYGDQMLRAQLNPVFEDILIKSVGCFVLVLIAFFLGMAVIERQEFRNKWPEQRKLLFPIALILLGMTAQSALSLQAYQQKYEECMMEGANAMMGGMRQTIAGVLKQGVDLAGVDGVAEYLAEKVDAAPILWNVKITEEVADAETVTGRGSSLLQRYPLGESGLMLEAEISTAYRNERLLQNMLLFLSTLIILVIFILELMRLPSLILYRIGAKANTECRESYLQVSSMLRISGFLCSTAEYICVPYAAMMIREWKEALPGLSVGMTAALPLSVEGLAQMAAMLVLPKWMKKWDIKKAFVLFGVFMGVSNLLCSMAQNALAVILLRGAAGVAYAGFKQVSNYLITRGWHTESERSRNLSQDNAGLLAGVTCGAGLGAIICDIAGYAMAFLASVVVVAAYVAITLCTVPWQWLAGKRQKEAQTGKTGYRALLSMFCSREMFRYIVLMAIPLNIGVQLCVTLVPAICQSRRISTMMLSYCYIVNGIAGIYIGPGLVNAAKRRLGFQKSLALAFGLTGVSIFLIKVPPAAVMLMIASMVFGFLDGFATPLTMDAFMEMSVVKRTVSESLALVICVVISYVLMTAAPIAAESMLIETGFALSPLSITGILYGVGAVLLAVPVKRKGGEDVV